jgi:Predicted inhibitor of MCP methylation, homolog of CheC
MFAQFFGNYIIKKNLITKAQLDEVIKHQKTIRVKLGLIAVSEKLLTPGKADEINRLQATMDKRFGDIAIERGYLTPEQLEHLLSLQGNPYLIFAQTVVEKGYMSLEEVEKYVLSYQKENNFSDSDLEAIKNGDIDKIIPIFIHINEPLYNDHIALAIRNIIRFVDTEVYFEKASAVTEFSFQHIAGQEMEGNHNILLGFSGDNSTLLSIANPFAKETFSKVDEDAYDSVCEFINCINGLFASKLSQEDVEIDMLPPFFYVDKKLVSTKPFYVVPIYISGQKIELALSVDTDLEIK